MTRNIATILGVPINSSPVDSLLREILDFEADSSLGKKLVIFTPNPEFLVEADQDAAFRKILSQADINWPESFGLILASRILGQPIRERLGGASLVQKLLEIGNERGWAIGVAGARGGVREEAEVLTQRLQERYPGLKLANLDDPEKNLKFQIVLACQGMKKQEKWILENKDKIKGKVFIGVGGSLDFLTGFAKRAPRWMQSVGLEWLWRGLQKPGHWKRIFNAVVIFPLLVTKQALTRNN